jgi:beta-carotene/zeaxanthin 4-ketolase
MFTFSKLTNCWLEPTDIESKMGIWVSASILGLWLGSLIFLLSLDLSQVSIEWVGAAILGRTFIHTGLFIVAHDAMHGNVYPRNRQINDWIGSLATQVYALLPYRKLCRSHWSHHRMPGQVGDPDFHDGIHANIFAWYITFMKGYLDTRQKLVLLGGMSLIFHGLWLVFHFSAANLFCFWVLPIVLSSIQLFVFGTYLPHRKSLDNPKHSHNATSSNYSTLLSFITCYHFGYHWEHHEYPDLPWYKLPLARRNRSVEPT